MTYEILEASLELMYFFKFAVGRYAISFEIFLKVLQFLFLQKIVFLKSIWIKVYFFVFQKTLILWYFEKYATLIVQGNPALKTGNKTYILINVLLFSTNNILFLLSESVLFDRPTFYVFTQYY